ncbi:unnamed protein product [Ambrosiozyma monospora]|uniref:Unnamed protein product n=1 Tax=Ambrosiozyma monospora TaxID=43982 RepID=A0A9W6YWU2_AMBMO|nr:unnamed protein product [Ambrosiozyma monospora]
MQHKRKNHKKHNSSEIPEYRIIDAILKFESSKPSSKFLKLPSNSLLATKDVMVERKTHNFYLITSEERQAHQFYKLDTAKYYSFVNVIERMMLDKKAGDSNKKNRKSDFDDVFFECLFPVVQFERNMIFVNEELRVIL